MVTDEASQPYKLREEKINNIIIITWGRGRGVEGTGKEQVFAQELAKKKCEQVTNEASEHDNASRHVEDLRFRV
jgi:hypothetical protein